MKTVTATLCSLLLPLVFCSGVIINSYRFVTSGGGGSDPYFANVILLLHADGSDGSTTFTDNSPLGLTTTATGNWQTDTANYKYGTASMLGDRTGDYATTTSTALYLGTGDFTVEMQVCLVDKTQDQGFFCFNNSFPTAGGGLEFGKNSLYWYSTIDGVSYTGYAAAATNNVWFHFAVVRASGVITIFKDGISQAVINTSHSSAAMNYNNLYLGAYYSSSYLLNGWLDEVRITKGVARYTTNFTPPTAAFPDS